MSFESGVSRRIVGVTADVRHESVRTAASPAVYLPYFQLPWGRNLSLAVRSPRSQGLEALVREQIRGFDASIPMYDVRRMDEIVIDSVRREQFLTILLVAFSLTALILATTGTYGVVSYSVALRLRETGIRRALGAQNSDIFRHSLAEAFRFIAAGLAIGLAGAFVLTQLLESLLYNVAAHDLPTFLIVVVFLSVSILAAAFVPARRAVRIDPLTALRHE